LVTAAQITIGHDTVTQSRTRVNDRAFLEPNSGANADFNNDRDAAALPFNNEGISFGVMFGAARQDFDLPLPYRQFHFRVVAIAAESDEYEDSELSTAVSATPGARSTSPSQSKALIEDAIARGAGGRGFIFIQIGTQTAQNACISESLYVPWRASAYTDYFGAVPEAQHYKEFVDRITLEIQHHPAYIGEETLIFFG